MAMAEISFPCRVGGLACVTIDDAIDDTLERAFSAFGEEILNDFETGRSRGFEFVIFPSEQSMKDYITVNEAQSPGRRGGDGGGGYGGHGGHGGAGYGGAGGVYGGDGYGGGGYGGDGYGGGGGRYGGGGGRYGGGGGRYGGGGGRYGGGGRRYGGGGGYSRGGSGYGGGKNYVMTVDSVSLVNLVVEMP